MFGVFGADPISPVPVALMLCCFFYALNYYTMMRDRFMTPEEILCGSWRLLLQEC
jgi:hypothetical protein